MSAGAATSSQTYHVYADGSCLGNPGPGGWAAVIVMPDGASRTIYGGDPSTTNNRMELTAAIEGLRVIPAGARVVLRSDSQYLVKTMTLGWKRNMNSDLWLKLDHEVGERKVRFEWVEGHAGDPLNEQADRQARAAAAIAGKTGHVHYHGLPIVEEEPPASAVESGEDDATVRELRPLLAAGESIRKCDGCGRAFVAAASQPDRHCQLAMCQLKARRSTRHRIK
ncbi:ribonuclease HI [bacterium]|nr:ribonuclease HI [bacterium]